MMRRQIRWLLCSTKADEIIDAQIQTYLGPPLSGAPFHSHAPAFNVLVHGRKLWMLLPPGRFTKFKCFNIRIGFYMTQLVVFTPFKYRPSLPFLRYGLFRLSSFRCHVSFSPSPLFTSFLSSFLISLLSFSFPIRCSHSGRDVYSSVHPIEWLREGRPLVMLMRKIDI